MFCSLILVLKTLYLYNDIIHLSYQTPPFSVFLYQYLIILLKKNVGNFKNSDLEKQYALADTTYVTDFNNASIAGRYRIYNASGSAAHGPYSGAVDGYVDILTDGNINTTGTKVYQTLHDYLGDVYTRVNVAGTSYGTWKKLTP